MVAWYDLLILVVLCLRVSPLNGAQCNMSSNIGKACHGRFGRVLQLHCFLPKYDILLWYKWNKKDRQWEAFPSRWQRRRVILDGDRNQTLFFLDLQRRDGGMYKCEAYKKQTVNYKKRVNVIECESMNGKSEIRDFLSEMSVQEGQTVTITCLGYFGCPDKDVRVVEWLGIDKKMLNSSKYTLRYFAFPGQVSKGVNLTIHHISQNDVKNGYTCRLRTNSSSYFNETIRIMHFIFINAVLVKKYRDSIITLCVFTFIGILFFIICKYQRKIKYVLKLKFCCGEKYHPALTPQFEAVSKSHYSVFLITNEALKVTPIDPTAWRANNSADDVPQTLGTRYQSLITTSLKCGRKLVFIELETIPAAKWESFYKNSEDKQFLKFAKSYHLTHQFVKTNDEIVKELHFFLSPLCAKFNKRCSRSNEAMFLI